MFIMRMITVTKKPTPHPIAQYRKNVLSIASRPEYSGNVKISSEVTSSTIAVTASQRLMSGVERGKIKLFHLRNQKGRLLHRSCVEMPGP